MHQVKNPAVALPVGIVGAVAICATVYILLSLVLCAMVPYADIQLGAPFSAAFLSLAGPDSDRMRTAFLVTSARFVSFGAVTGVLPA